MAFFNEFPHTRTYDSDLAWLIKRMKEILTRMDSLEERMAALEALVTDFINSANIPQLIADELQRMIDDGRIDEVVSRLIRELTAIQDWGTPVLNHTGSTTIKAYQTCLYTRRGTSISESMAATLGLNSLKLYKANGKKRLVLEMPATRMGNTSSIIDTISTSDNILLFQFIADSGNNADITYPWESPILQQMGNWNPETVELSSNLGGVSIDTGHVGASTSINLLRSVKVLCTPTTLNRDIANKVIMLEDFDVYDTP